MERILPSEYLAESLPKINDNFTELENDIIDYNTQVQTMSSKVNALTQFDVDDIPGEIIGSGLEGANGSPISVNVDEITLTINSQNQIAIKTISEDQLPNIAGRGIQGGNGIPYSVKVDGTSIEIKGDSIGIKTGGLNSSYLNLSSITPAKITDGTIGRDTFASYSIEAASATVLAPLPSQMQTTWTQALTTSFVYGTFASSNGQIIECNLLVAEDNVGTNAYLAAKGRSSMTIGASSTALATCTFFSIVPRNYYYKFDIYRASGTTGSAAVSTQWLMPLEVGR